MAKKEQALTVKEQEQYLVPAGIDENNPFTAEDLAEEAEGLTPRFPQIKIPSGGSIAFEIPNLTDPDDPDTEKTIEGIILHHHAANACWVDPDNTDNKAPDCSSMDGKIGVGVPGGECASCPLNQWESGEGGKGKMCKNTRRIYIARPGERIPVLLTLPPTSLGAFNDYINRAFIFRQRGACGSITQIGLKKMENSGGQSYSVAVFKTASDLKGEQLLSWIAYAKEFKAQIKAMQNAAQVAPLGDMATREVVNK